MDRWRGKTAIVTGAASGMGAAITQALLSKGINVVGLDIQKERLEKTANETNKNKNFGKLHPIRCDLTQYDDIQKAFKFADENMGGVDIMVNNAGICNYSRIIDSDRQTFERLLNIDVLAMATCIKKAVASMKARKVEGHIFNINSALGHIIPESGLSEKEGCNGWNLYPACKHATVAMTECVRNEIKAAKLPIRITGICPGLVKTEMGLNIPEVKEFVESLPRILPEDIADALMYALGTRHEVQVSEMSIQRTGNN
ncbi:farnesol dehydrogenase-like [Leptopilina boulardi]|uniref:farnesol dehydrogenase-like n=1 Tax=Leptopilina boulardi TaxID=63433 RepID=UPI0021F65281|nr:farnesol dehydrogenase-like [Leptopilina boulardi]